MKISIAYQPQTLPPPYAYAAAFELELSSKVHVTFAMEYLGRSDLDTDEILAEGFSLNDDFEWSGEIGSGWRSVIVELQSMSYQKKPHEDSYIHIEVDGQANGFPKNHEKSEQLIQELMQAVFEASGREETLKLFLWDDDKKETKLEWFFNTRKVRKNDQDDIDWESARKLLESIYAVQYEEIDPLKKAESTCISFDGQYWYPVPQANWRKIIQFFNY